MRKRYFNTAFAESMVPDGDVRFATLSSKEASAWLQEAAFENVANPDHANTLDALSRKTAVELREGTGARVTLGKGDQVLVGGIRIPDLGRVTREYTDVEVASAIFRFRLVIIL